MTYLLRLFWAGYWAVVSLLCVLLASAVLLLGCFLALPSIVEFAKPYIEERFEVSLSIDGMTTHWQGGRPRLTMSELQLSSASSNILLSSKAIDVELDLQSSFSWRRPLFSRLSITRPYIFYQAAPSVTDTQALPTTTQPAGLVSRTGLVTSLLTSIMRQPSIDLTDGSLRLILDGKPSILVDDLSIISQGGDQFGQVILNAQLSAPSGDKVAINGVAESGLARSAPMRLKVSLPNVGKDWLNSWLPSESQHFSSISLSQTALVEFRFGQLNRLVADVTLRDVEWDKVKLAEVQGRVDVQPRWSKGGYQLQLASSVTDANGAQLMLPKLALDFEDRLLALPKTVAIEPFALSSVMSFVTQQAFVPDKVADALNGFDFDARLSNMVFAVSKPTSASLDYPSLVGSAYVEGFTMQPFMGAPGLKKIDGTLVFAGTEGYVDIDSQSIEVEVPGMGLEPWSFDEAFGRLHWSLKEDRALLASGPMTVKQDETTGRGRFSVTLPYLHDEQSELSLMIGSQSAPLLSFLRYIPPDAVGQQTYEWIASAFSSGVVNTGSFLLSGKTKQRLPDWAPPTVQIFLDTQSTGLRFDPDWPAVDAQRARFLLREGGFYSEFFDGDFLDSGVIDGFAALDGPEQDIVVQARANGPLSDISRVLIETPVSSEVGDEPERWRFTKGVATTDVLLRLPTVGDKPKPKMLNVTTTVSDGEVEAEAYSLLLQQVQGSVHFNLSSGIMVKEATARFLDSPVTVSATSLKTPSLLNPSVLEDRLVIDAQGTVEVDPLKKWLSLPMMDVMSGVVPYRFELPLCKTGQGCNLISVDSDLSGTRLDGFGEFAKTESESWPSHVGIQLFKSGSQNIWLDLGGRVHGVFKLANGTLERGRVALAQASPDMPEQPGFYLTGRLKSLDVEKARDFLERAHLLGSAGANAAKVENQQVVQPNLFKRANIEADYLNYQEYLFKDVELALDVSDSSMDLLIDSPTAKGEIRIPTHLDSNPVTAHFDRLVIVPSVGESEDKQPTEQANTADLTQLPNIEFSVADLEYDGKKYGQWVFNLLPDAWGATFQGIAGDFAGAKISGDARWSQGGEAYSAALLQISGNDLGDLVQQVGTDPVIESNLYNADVRLVWPGAPWEFALASLSGDLDMTIERGRLLDIEKSNLLMRGLGVLNLETLTRRLRLDFSDLTKQGVSFDRIGLQYRLINGVANTREPSTLNGPSIDLEMQGSVNLADKSLDQTVKVILPVTKNLPLMGLLLGQPQIAGAVYLFDKLIGGKIEKATGLNYKVAGSWNDPEVELLNSSNANQ